MASESDIAKLLGSIDRYNTKEVDKLVSFLKKTVADNTYNIEVYLAILKLYQFYPEKFDLETTKCILLKTLASLPNSDFTLCLYLLTEEKLADPGIAQLKELYRLLESCLFNEFWALLKAQPQILQTKVLIGTEHVPAEIVGLQEHIHVAHIVNSTYQTISSALLSSMLGGLDATQLASFASTYGWNVNGDKVFIKNQEDCIKSKNIVENIPFKALTRIVVSSFKQ